MTEILHKVSKPIRANKKTTIPEHIAIIMDGNRRYAKKENLTLEDGHIAGAKNLLKITEAAVKLGVKVLTVYAFSTENWLRSDPEIQSLFYIFEVYYVQKINVWVCQIPILKYFLYIIFLQSEKSFFS